MSEKIKKRPKVFEPQYFGLILGALIFITFVGLAVFSDLDNRLEMKMLDVHFYLKSSFRKISTQEGVTQEQRNPNISPDILILGIDNKSLNDFGKWPFPRFREADLVNTFARIQDQNQRESSLFLDIFFNDPDSKAIDDVLLIDAIKNSGRVFLETFYEYPPMESDLSREMFSRQDILIERFGQIENIRGDVLQLNEYFSIQAPLKPYANVVAGFGHANYHKDYDKKFRRQRMIVRTSNLIEEIRLDDLSPDYQLDLANHERLAWFDKKGIPQNIEYPLSRSILENLSSEMEKNAPLKTVDTDKDGTPDDSFFIIRKYEDRFVPAITLVLALNYFNKDLTDLEVVLGEYIRIPDPQKFNTETGEWEKYSIIKSYPVYDEANNLVKEAELKYLDEIVIPINEKAELLVNFMGQGSDPARGGQQTFPVRPFSGYATRVPGPDSSSWPRTKAVDNKILMCGAFALGLDEKTTPYGLMYGVEIHANALNTIIMDQFLHEIPWYVNLLVLLTVIMVMAFITSRMSTGWSLFLAIFLVLAMLISFAFVFELHNLIINFTGPAIGTIFTFITVVVYRVITEEGDKRRIKDMFGKYVSPIVVDQMMENPPELGGVDCDVTIFFSDIRSFTSLSETMTPQELVELLNLYLTAMTDCIMEFNGTLDKYIGDAIMCFWGAPIPQEDHALLACRCAVRQLELLNDLNKTLPENKQIHIGIGLNSGVPTVGNMGSEGRMNYTVMGDDVNLASRLEGTNKQYYTEIIISEKTYELIKGSGAITRELDDIRVKGKRKPVKIYELLGFEDK
ncbi:MAG: adenylate/guanylate cyclase domain-containing protein [Calditrichaeota bacterium]|nr:MAG: adenylate/guanylate cyclase domain-containing protein [Calditrichota bacterium]